MNGDATSAVSARRTTMAMPLAGVFIVLALCANAVPYFYGETLFDFGQVTQAARPWQIVAIGSLFAAVVTAILTRRASTSGQSSAVWAIGAISIYLMFNALLSTLSDVSALYSTIFVAVAYSINALRLTPAEWILVLRRAAFASASMLIVFVLIKHREGRWYGAVHPNFMGIWLLVQASLMQTWRGRFRWLAIAGLLTLTILVDSRFSFLAILLLSFSTEFLRRLRSPSRMLIFWLICGVALLVVGGYAWDVLLGEGARSALGDISGRTERWATAFARIQERPVFGYGFRTSREEFQTAHSGIITLWEELGFIGAAAFLGLAAARMWTLFRLVLSSESENVKSLAIMLLGSLIAYMSPLIFQPNYLNFGDPLGILLLLCLFIPVSFRGYTAEEIRPKRTRQL